MSSSSGITPILRLAVRALLLIFALFWFVFALLSGAGQHGQGIGVMLRNLPNAMPWLALFILIYIAIQMGTRGRPSGRCGGIFLNGVLQRPYLTSRFARRLSANGRVGFWADPLLVFGSPSDTVESIRVECRPD